MCLYLEERAPSFSGDFWLNQGRGWAQILLFFNIAAAGSHGCQKLASRMQGRWDELIIDQSTRPLHMDRPGNDKPLTNLG